MKIHKDLKPEDWIEIRYKGKTHLVGVRSLLGAWIGRPTSRSVDGDMEGSAFGDHMRESM